MEKEKTIRIQFCGSCKFHRKLEDWEDSYEKTHRCPQCEKYSLWVIEECKIIEHGKVVFVESALTDNDEVSFHGRYLSELNRLWNKGYKLFKKLKNENIQD